MIDESAAVICQVEQVFEAWIERFEVGEPIQYTPARAYASDAVRDCRDAVLKILVSGKSLESES